MTGTEIALTIGLVVAWVGIAFLVLQLASKERKLSKVKAYVKRARKIIPLQDNPPVHLIMNAVLEIIYENE